MSEWADPTDGLRRLLDEDADIVAARLFAECFGPEAKDTMRVRSVSEKLAAMAGVRQKWYRGASGPGYLLALEMVLIWERGLLATRLAAGESGTLVQILRAGEAARRALDPSAAALSAIRAAGRS